MADLEPVTSRILEEDAVIVFGVFVAGTFDIVRTDLPKHSRDLVDFRDARGPKGDSIFVRRVSRRLSYTEELGWPVSLRIVLQPVGNVHVFGETEPRQECAVELSDRSKLWNAKINVVEATHNRFLKTISQDSLES